MILVDWGLYAATGVGPAWNWGGGEVVAGPGTGEYLERFDVFGADIGRMSVFGVNTTQVIVYGGDSEE